MIGKRVLLGVSIASAVAQILSTSAHAAQPGSNAAGELEEVVVTAERREANLQSVPVAVSAFTADAIANRQIAEAADLQRVVPSLKMTNNITTPTNLSPSLRGSTVQDASVITAESPFGIYIDDVYVGRMNGNNVTLADIERVEVLRGPQGTLYGRNTLAGAIKFVSQTPGRESWFRATAGLGNYDQYVGSFSVGHPLSDSWAGSLSAQVNGKDGEFRNVTVGKDVDHQRNWAVRGKLHFNNGGPFDAVFSLSHSDSTNDALQQPGGLTPTVPSNRQFTSDDIVLRYGDYKVGTPFDAKGPLPVRAVPQASSKQTIASANLAYDFGSVTLRSISGYVKLKDYFSTDFSGGAFVGLLPLPQPVIAGSFDTDHDQFTQELQLQGRGDRLNYIVGAYYFREKGTQNQGWYFFLPTSSGSLDAKTTSYSLFGQADWKFTDALKLTVGARWTKDEKDYENRFSGLPFPGALLGLPFDLPARTDRVALSNSYSAFTPKVGIDYSLPSSGSIDSMLLYASAARGFKSGGYNAIAIFGLDDARKPYFPEKNWTYEAGLKTDLAGNRLRINAAYFYEKISDLQLNATLAGGTSFPVQNVADETLHGLELETTWVATQGLTFYLNAALMDGKFSRITPGSSVALAAPSFGVKPEPPQLPKYTLSLGFDYGVELGSGKLKFGGDWFRTDDYLVAATNDFKVTAYDRFNAFVGYDFGNTELRLSVKNLTDQAKIVSGSRALGGFILLPPREVLATVSWKM
jgi:iron complex outermembrane receptor protein